MNDMKYIYLCTSPILSGVKVGKWSNPQQGLMSLYQTKYGSDVYIIAFECKDVSGLKKSFKEYFTEYHITLDLFEKTTDLMVKYIEYLIKFSDKFTIVSKTINQDYHKHCSISKKKDDTTEIDYDQDIPDDYF
jgi:hypothetical protein